jgi:hypothetical protein
VRRGRVRPGAAVPARLRLVRRADRCGLGPRPRRASVGGADAPPRLDPLRRAGRRRHRRHRRDGPPGNPRGCLASTSTCSWPGCSAAPPSGIRAGTRGARRARTFRTSDRATSSTRPRGRRLSATPCWIHPSPGGLDARPRHRRLVKISRAFVDGQPSDGLARDSIVGNITLYWLAGTGTRRTWCEPRGAAVRGHSGPRRSGRRRRAWRRCYGYGC